MENKWIKKAIILGFVFFIAIYLVKPVGVSTQFSVLSGIVHSSIDKSVIVPDDSRKTGYQSSNEYYDKSDGKLAKNIKNPMNYDFVFVLAIPVGSFIGYLIMRNKRANNENPKKQTCSVNTKQNNFKLYIAPFLGGFILLFGARMADGCTSGHMMSGMMQGSLIGYVFATAVFLTAIPTAIIVKKLKARNI